MLGFLLVAVLAQAPAQVVPEKKVVVEPDVDPTEVWLSFSWGDPWEGAIGMRVELGNMVTIDDKAGVLAQVDRVGPGSVRVRVWCGRNESFDPVVDQVLPFPGGETSAGCDGLGGLCTGRVRIKVREVF